MARIGNTVLSLGATAASAIAANRFVGFDDAQAGAVGQKVKGVADYAAAKGDPVALTAKGTAFVETGGVFAAGAPIISDASGRAVAGATLAVAAGAVAVTGTAANGLILSGGEPPDWIVGHALTASAGAGGYVEILLR